MGTQKNKKSWAAPIFLQSAFWAQRTLISLGLIGVGVCDIIEQGRLNSMSTALGVENLLNSIFNYLDKKVYKRLLRVKWHFQMFQYLTDKVRY